MNKQILLLTLFSFAALLPCSTKKLKGPGVSVSAIIVKDGKMLLGKRKNAVEAGHWAAPGGKLEAGESPEECGARELKEETNLRAISMHRGPWLYNVVEDTYCHITIFMYIDEYEGEPELIEPHKCEGWHWLPLNDALYQDPNLSIWIKALIDLVGLDELTAFNSKSVEQ